MKKLKYLVVGTGRCGTVYLARLLTSMGVPCGHESFFDYQGIDAALNRLDGKRPVTLSRCSQTEFNGCQEYFIEPYVDNLDKLVAESSYMAVPYMNHDCLKQTIMVHVVRHPIKVINSFVNYMKYFFEPTICTPPGPIYESFIYKHLPELLEYKDAYERASMYYILWNQMIERHAVIGRFKAEDGPSPIINALSLQGKTPFDQRNVNSYASSGDRFHIDMLPNGEVKKQLVEIGERYGYYMSSDYLLM